MNVELGLSENVQVSRRLSDSNDQDLDRTHDHVSSTQEGFCGKVIRFLLMTLGILVAIIPISWIFCIKVFSPYERCVHFRLGQLKKPAKGPGVFFMIPFVDTFERVSLRTQTINVPTQETMSKDSVTCSVDAVIYFHVRDAIKSVIMIQDPVRATSLLAQTTLRSVIGECELDELLQKRELINTKIKRILDQSTEEWGVRVTTVEVKDVVLPQQMQRAMASQAEAERERRAKVISAEGELQASRTLLNAATEMTKNPATIQLRYLQTLTQIAVEKNSTIVFPLPLELMNIFKQSSQTQAANPINLDALQMLNEKKQK